MTYSVCRIVRIGWDQDNYSFSSFYEVKKYLKSKTDSLNLDDSLKPNSLNPADTVLSKRTVYPQYSEVSI